MKNYVIYMLLLIIATLFIGLLTDIFIAFTFYGITAISGFTFKNLEVK
ncbi:hypothetical protein [Staphylococcus saprophyticus]|nr:hypothetical protein [Staphylococcus saprophyticus]MDW4258925.1 hypothetical protein [Staphylococcus saprophyticus]MDW4324126.1 hypothetical protein [Staphylococcus saprophyticus]MDW4331840.1 hypothetical protein [Staphylococcus saprophyticus]MDW4418147.1 hypothetical protein [Staphylococcus saprophyticus]